MAKKKEREVSVEHARHSDMALIKAYTLPHPPLAVPAVGRGQEREIDGTVAAYNEISQEIADLAPETIVFVTPHSILYSDYFHISPGATARGDFSRFGVPAVKIDAEYDMELAEEISHIAGRKGVLAGGKGERDAKLDHGVMVPMWFINKHCKEYKTVRISQSGMDPSAHYKLGMAITEAAEITGRKTILIASSDLSHKLKSDGPYGLAPEGREFDDAVIGILSNGDFLSLLKIPERLREGAAECGYNSLMVLAGALDMHTVKARLLSYEGPFGVGYAIASFIPGNPDKSRDILAQFEDEVLHRARGKRDSEDHYRSLACRSLEYAVISGGELPVPDGLPDEMIKTRAGVFVSLHKNERLRGCIGTISATTACVAKEIIENAVKAGLSDPRFDPVTASELPYLTYKVDVLSDAEPISGPGELDVKRYGVIVSSGYKRGLLLPNLDGVDTVEEQISIARRKAGIRDNAPVNLERFEVVRHE